MRRKWQQQLPAHLLQSSHLGLPWSLQKSLQEQSALQCSNSPQQPRSPHLVPPLIFCYHP